eukprot:1389012-Rhodomonas_salina.1
MCIRDSLSPLAVAPETRRQSQPSSGAIARATLPLANLILLPHVTFVLDTPPRPPVDKRHS